MCLICEIAHDFRRPGGRHAYERRVAAMMVLILQIAHDPDAYEEDHIEEVLVNNGYTRTEIKDMRAAALAGVYALAKSGLIRRPKPSRNDDD